MAKISMVISDAALAEIDSCSGGNRTAFMVAAALERAKSLRRQREDDEIAAQCAANAESDVEFAAEWDATLTDGLD